MRKSLLLATFALCLALGCTGAVEPTARGIDLEAERAALMAVKVSEAHPIALTEVAELDVIDQRAIADQA